MTAYSRDQLLAQLEQWGIQYELIEHPAVSTMTESARLMPGVVGDRCKSLLLRDKRGNLSLLATASDSRPVDLSALRSSVGSSRLSFASSETMAERLGVLPGALSPLALVNDASRSVVLWVDRALWSASVLLLHPLVNTATVAISTDGVETALTRMGIVPTFVDVQRMAPRGG